MTIAVLVSVNDGLVLAADSATTLIMPDASGQPHVTNIYNNANKIFNLCKGLPIGAMTWGMGSIGPSSIATLAKDLRRRFAGRDPEHRDWRLKRDEYEMAQVAGRVKEFFYDERYSSLPAGVSGELGLLVGGYSAEGELPEAFLLKMDGPNCEGPDKILAGAPDFFGGAAWWGQPEAITRLMLGVSQSLPQALRNLGVPETDVLAYTSAIQQQVQEQLVSPAMPIQDAIDLADFLVEMTIKFVRFSPGNPTVGGPVEVAAVTKHEGFKWVSRKHYFQARLNPADGSTV